MSSPSPPDAIDMLSLVNKEANKNSIDKLLADVPALSVGLLGFAALTFFMILKKVKLAPFILLSSVIFTFLAAIIDLSRISLQHDNSSRVRSENKTLSETLKTVREVLSSVASGLRFLYFWAFVSQPPLCEQGSGSFLRLHSGSWLHWGLTGTVLRWSTLLASLSIFVLQILWRTTRKFGPVYNVESALEIGASGVYMVKLLLNSMIVEEDCRRETLWQYSTALFALFINLGVGVGNLLEFRFSDTSLGRLLLATALYTLIVSSMVFSFYTRPPAPPPLRLPNLRDKRASSFRGLHVSFYDADLGLVGEDIANLSGSPPQRPSSWLSWNAPQRRSSQTSPSYGDRRRPRRSEGEETERGPISSSPKNGTSIPDTQPSSINTDPITRGISEDFSSSPITRLPADAVYDSGKSSGPRAAAMTTSPDSPTLGGIGGAQPSDRPFRRTQQPSDGSFTSSQGSGFENLLREQNELERNIAALRTMFVQGGSGEEQKLKTSDAISDPPEQSKLRDSLTTTAYGPTSASGRSDFSLSVFPEPPEIPRVTEKPRTYESQSPPMLARTPTQRTFNMGEQGFPVSTAEGDDMASLAFGRRTESAGTHYDVTSFIGDLTSPINRASATQIAMYLKDSDTESEAASADLATIVSVERRPSNGIISRPHLVEKTSLASELSRPPSARSRVNSARGGAATRQHSSRPHRGTPSPPVGFTRTPPSRPLTPAGRVVGLPSRPKLDVSPRGDQ